MGFRPFLALLTRVLLLVICDGHSSRKDVWHMLAPINSTLSLFCDPIFEKPASLATWYKDDRKLGSVRSNQNLLIGQPLSNSNEQNIPEVGFLVLQNIERSDEGLYWCKTDLGKKSQTTILRVAYLEKEFIRSPGWSLAINRRPVTLPCGPPVGHPPPSVFWLKNSQKLPSDGRIKVLPNGDLRIESFSVTDSGQYTCVARNIAGRQSSTGYIVPQTLFKVEKPNPSVDFDNYKTLLLWGHALWFLAGVVTTGAVILVYILIAFCCLRPRRRSIRPVNYVRLGMAPGFRKRSQTITNAHRDNILP